MQKTAFVFNVTMIVKSMSLNLIKLKISLNQSQVKVSYPTEWKLVLGTLVAQQKSECFQIMDSNELQQREFLTIVGP